MALFDRLLNDTAKKQIAGAKDPYYEDEEYFMYKEKERSLDSLNDKKDVFHTRFDDQAINKQENVFDRTAIFRTKNQQE